MAANIRGDRRAKYSQNRIAMFADLDGRFGCLKKRSVFPLTFLKSCSLRTPAHQLSGTTAAPIMTNFVGGSGFFGRTIEFLRSLIVG
jgi:hypothetical protein